jgi:hypothetical protein
MLEFRRVNVLFTTDLAALKGRAGARGRRKCAVDPLVFRQSQAFE